ncbi:MAG: deoxyguanosinetriphosphate triphosphohydrolase [Actinobacteria bacterium]|nr:deoxyguanosinetriphosphate triphosphohydrolase [Actinomycetota bacterium]MTA29956.1 deoxyguanosinetriphosphate triphosphohydrolase [Actinomycetota bacterium]
MLIEGRSGTQRRNEFSRDRARVLHSSALRRLGAKTQVLSPASGDFARTRLTHSLEVAQIGREMALTLGIDPDLVDMACLAHDLGHPPFGHNGEKALNDWSEQFGGFEGNAQTLRLLTRIEPKVFAEDGSSFGLNLTRASLDAACKYPWSRSEAVFDDGGGARSSKFGVYEDDLPVFEWLRIGAPDRHKSIEAQVMDFADDVAYSVHDYEDAIVEGFISLDEISRPEFRKQLIADMLVWAGSAQTAAELDSALSRLQALDGWLVAFDGSDHAHGDLKNLTSALIGSFVSRTVDATVNEYSGLLTRYRANVIVPAEVESEIAVLKGLVSSFLMSHESRRPFYERQREILIELADSLLANNGKELDSYCTVAWSKATDETAKHRTIVDQVACLTDQAAINLHQRLTGGVR